MFIRSHTEPYSFGIIGICLLYFVIQFFYVPFSLISQDDFWLAYHTFQYHNALPYRDFAPYKTVLGYYLLLLPMSLYHGILAPLIKTKLFVALINTGVLFCSARSLNKYFPVASVMTGLLLVTFTHFFLSYATEIRVDMLAYWLCLVSVLWIFDKRYVLAGLTFGISFLVSQKALWQIAGIEVALLGTLIAGILSTRKEARLVYLMKECKTLFSFHLAMLLPIVCYIAFWSYYASFHTVMRSMFYEAYLVAALDSYDEFRMAFWQVSLTNNPLFFLLFPLTLLSLLIAPANDKHYMKRLFLFLYASITTLMIVNYKQPFLYNMIVLIPPYFLLYTAFYAWVYEAFQTDVQEVCRVSQKTIMAVVGIYLSSLILIVCCFSLPVIYAVMGLFPLLLTRYLLSENRNHGHLKSVAFTTILLVTLFTGILYPLTRFVGSLDEMDGHYQKYMLHLTNTLLQGKGEYVAGVSLFYDRDQPVAGLRHLSVVSLDYLYQPTEKLREPMQLDSLYFSPDNADEIIASLKVAPVKLFVNNNRFIQIPPKIKNYLQTQYQHFWGSIYLYAPQFTEQEENILIKFKGKYKLESLKPVSLDGQTIKPSTFIILTAGNHRAEATSTYRLRFIPQHVTHPLNPDYEKDAWQRLLF